MGEHYSRFKEIQEEAAEPLARGVKGLRGPGMAALLPVSLCSSRSSSREKTPSDKSAADKPTAFLHD